ncbi:hypothetical protein EF913_23100 [Streptomyces sp. WAC04189]|uniref:hypothetical protein n=1 Tax=Streptomyces sp. WAC04189 TaxID=2487411 RepID=UPI000FBFE4BD|nr:hypothetical protein [Streptomyces sp. WAC04189]RSR99564.1 hypothetical protein EF913_23100 [Streptomyces sp. WAC04189]
MQTDDARKCQRGGCQFERPLKPRAGGGNRRERFCSGACAIVYQKAHQALRTKKAAEVAEASRLIDALNARTSPRGFIPGLFPERKNAA